jgi:hypothetical protein
VHAVACASGSNEPQRPLQPRSGSNGDHKEAVRAHTAAAASCFLSHFCIQMKRLQMMEEVIISMLAVCKELTFGR